MKFRRICLRRPKKCLKGPSSQLSLRSLCKTSMFGKKILTPNIEPKEIKIRKRLKLRSREKNGFWARTRLLNNRKTILRSKIKI